MAADDLTDLAPCPACGCPAATHFSDPVLKTLNCPPEGSDPFKLAEMVARAPAIPRPSVMDPASIKNSTRDQAARAIDAYRRNRRTPEPPNPEESEEERISRRTGVFSEIEARTQARIGRALEFAFDFAFAGRDGIGTDPPFANMAEPATPAADRALAARLAAPKLASGKPAPKRRFVVEDE